MNKRILVLALFLALAGCHQTAQKTTSTTPVLDRINKTSTIRCGYASWPPYFIVDPNTKKMSGVFYDVAEEIGKRLHLKIDWAEEVGWGTVAEAVKTHRSDMACSAFWINSTRAPLVDFSAPIVYAIGNIWIRASDDRAFQSKADFDKPNIKFSYMDGAAESKAIQMNFSHATQLSLPELTSTAEQFEGLVGGKYDAVVYDDASAMDFLKSRPGTIKKSLPDDPVAIYPTVMLLPPGETQLKAMIDNTIREIQYDGTMQKILEKNNVQNLVKLPAKPYQE